jgi:hypothetical protein
MVVLLIHSIEVDPSRAVDVILESKLNQKIFKALMKYYQEVGYYKEYLVFGKSTRSWFDPSEEPAPIDFSYKTLEELGETVEESDLKTLERSLDALSNVHLVGIYRNRENKLYSVPSKGIFYTKDNKTKTFGFEEYIGMIKDRFNLIAQVNKYLDR